MRASLSLLAGIALAGCSVHPIPDDVSPIPTEEIVRSMRCEVKHAVRKEIQDGLDRLGLADIVPDEIVQPHNLARVRAVRTPADPGIGLRVAQKFEDYSLATMAYAFEFDITEHNGIAGNVGFKLPFVPSEKGAFDLAAHGEFAKVRQAKRVFKTSETFAELRRLDCGPDFVVRDKNLIYPITGSIGMTKVVHTFVELSEIGGAQGDFTDTLTFTTTLEGSLSPRLVLRPVPNRFRVVNADGILAAGRTDIHKVTITFAFPQFRPAALARLADAKGRGVAGALATPESAKARAIEQLCIARARDREEEFGTLRLYPPEISCAQQRLPAP